MPNPNLNDVVGWIEDIKRQIARLKSGAFLENSSISDGMLRLIRATLRLEGGALLKGEGTFDWTGPGSVAGDWEVLGGGVIRVGGVLISPVGGGRIMVGAGPVAIILDGGTGTLTSGDIRMEGGRIYVGTGASQIVIDGATGKILAGNLAIDPNASGGSITFGDGRTINASSTGIGIYDGDRFVVFNSSGVTMYAGGASVSVGSFGIRMDGLATISETDSGGLKPGSHYSGTTGIVYLVVPD